MRYILRLENRFPLHREQMLAVNTSGGKLLIHSYVLLYLDGVTHSYHFSRQFYKF